MGPLPPLDANGEKTISARKGPPSAYKRRPTTAPSMTWASQILSPEAPGKCQTRALVTLAPRHTAS